MVAGRVERNERTAGKLGSALLPSLGEFPTLAWAVLISIESMVIEVFSMVVSAVLISPETMVIEELCLARGSLCRRASRSSSWADPGKERYPPDCALYLFCDLWNFSVSARALSTCSRSLGSFTLGFRITSGSGDTLDLAVIIDIEKHTAIARLIDHHLVLCRHDCNSSTYCEVSKRQEQ